LVRVLSTLGFKNCLFYRSKKLYPIQVQVTVRFSLSRIFLIQFSFRVRLEYGGADVTNTHTQCYFGSSKNVLFHLKNVMMPHDAMLLYRIKEELIMLISIFVEVKRNYLCCWSLFHTDLLGITLEKNIA